MYAEGCEGRQGCTSVNLQYPQLSSGPFMNEINKDILETVAEGLSDEDNEGEKKSIDELIADFFKSNNTFIEAYPELESSYGWNKDVECSVLRLGSNILSLKYSVDSFTGGAHPTWFTYYYNYDLTTGKVIELDDMVAAGDRESLNQAVGQVLKKMRGIEPYESLDELLKPFVEKFEASENFLLQEDGVLFYYNSYEIGAYFEGPTKVFVSYADLPFFTQP